MGNQYRRLDSSVDETSQRAMTAYHRFSSSSDLEESELLEDYDLARTEVYKPYIPMEVSSSVKLEGELGKLVQIDTDSLEAGISGIAKLYLSGVAKGEVTAVSGPVTLSAMAAAIGNAEAKAYANCKAVNKGLFDGLEAMAECGVELSLNGTLSGEASAKIGMLDISLKASLDAMAKVAIKAEADIKIGLKEGINMGFSLDALASASVEAKGTATINLGDFASASAGCWAKAFATAEASASGRFTFTGDSLNLSGSVTAGVSVGAEIGASGKISINGDDVVTAKLSTSVKAGLAFSMGGSFSFEDGKLVLNFDICAVLGIGGGFDGTIEINFRAIGIAFAEVVYNALKKSKVTSYTPLIDDGNYKTTVIPLLKALGGHQKIQYLTRGTKDDGKAFSDIEWAKHRQNLIGKVSAYQIQVVLNNEMKKAKYANAREWLSDDMITACEDAIAAAWTAAACQEKTGTNIATVRPVAASIGLVDIEDGSTVMSVAVRALDVPALRIGNPG